jgi:hypothetical protein
MQPRLDGPGTLPRVMGRGIEGKNIPQGCGSGGFALFSLFLPSLKPSLEGLLAFP